MMLKRGRVANFAAPPSNPNATKEARLLYARLKNQFGAGSGSERGFFIGANESSGAAPYFYATKTRVEDIAGKTPLMLTTFPVAQDDQNYSAFVQRVKDHYSAGGICATIFHPDNYLTGGPPHDRDRDNWDAVHALLSPSGSHLATYRAKLDILADTLNNDLVVDGVKIPHIIRLGGEANGWVDYPDRNVINLTRSGTTATMQITAPSGTVEGFGVGRFFQIRGAADSGWNSCWKVGAVSYGSDNTSATITFTVPGSLASSPSGTITSYALSGYFWAGADRASALNTLIQQTVVYLRDTKGCNQLIFGSDCFTYNRIYESSKNSNNAYSLWLDGMDNYYDFVSVNLYQDNDLSWGQHDFGNQYVVENFNVWADWAEARGRPIFIHEYGALVAGQSLAGFWTDKCFSAFDDKYQRLAGAAFFRPPWLPDAGSPVGNDLAKALSNPRYRWLT